MRRFAILLGLTACNDRPMTEETSGHLKDLGAIRMRGRDLADLIRATASRPELEAMLRSETVSFCEYPEHSKMQALMDSGIALDVLYPADIAADAFFVRCFVIQLRTGEIVKFDVAKRQWTRTGEFEELRRD